MSSRHEQGKAKAETVGRAKMSSRQEQEKARTANISFNRDHGKAIKTIAPGTARDAGSTGTGGEYQEPQEQFLLASMGARNSHDGIDRGGRKGDKS